jgi:hypothetical protein
MLLQRLRPLLVLLTLAITGLSQNLNTYHFPICAQSCVAYVYPTGCVLGDDSCTCINIPYLNEVAACIGLSCTAAGLDTSAAVFIYDCDASGTSFALSRDEFVAAGNGGAAASSFITVASPTSAMEAGPTASDASSMTTEKASETTKAVTPKQTQSGGVGLSTSDKIALGVGIGFGVPTTIGVIVTCWMCLRGR